MNSPKTALKVGFSTLLIVVLAFGVFRFVRKGMSGASGYHVWAHFHDATGLTDKARVQIAGLTVGEITSRTLDGQVAKVTLKVGSDVKMWENATVFKKTVSLLGDFYVEIDPGTPESPDPETGQPRANKVLGEGDQVRNVVEAVTTTDVLVQVNETLPILRQILLDIQEVTKGPLKELTKSLQSGVERNSKAAETLLGHLDQIALDVRQISGGQSREDLRQTVANMRDITDGLRDLLGKKGTESGGQQARQNLERVATAIESLNRTLANTAEVTDRINKGQGTVGRLLHDDTIANNVEQITEDVGGFVRSITRLQTIVGLRSEYNVLANSLKTYVSVQLQSRPDKFFLIELVDDPRGTRSTQRTFVTTDDPQKPQTVSTETVTVSSSFRFSFQIAKKLFLLGGKLNLTGRFGIKESTGGVGMDLEMPLRFARRWFPTLEFKFDLFDFRANIYPRLKILAALEFFKHVWIVAGLDDILNGQGPSVSGSLIGRDYFFGAMLTFNDEDLRALFAVGGGAAAGAAR